LYGLLLEMVSFRGNLSHQQAYLNNKGAKHHRSVPLLTSKQSALRSLNSELIPHPASECRNYIAASFSGSMLLSRSEVYGTECFGGHSGALQL